MLRIAALLTATYLGAFVATSALTVPDGLRTAFDRLNAALTAVASLPAGAQARGSFAHEPVSVGTTTTARLGKSAALPRLRGAHGPARSYEPSEIEATPQGLLAMRDADGRLLFLRDAAAGETLIARGADLPRLVAEPAGDAPRLDVAPGAEPVESDGRDETDAPLAAGCESAVSPLARVRRAASGVLCIAAL